ncbi:lysophospholipid acyltransferase family protein [Lampropedia puyangensis]|uniref:Lysophospholipid acyltransferase family protein n=1 Tax=Lampropedia puyangensis TaxID=1330072 RepID=A0A4S8FD40_9BURK|nr:lysophospholipid acyltransferase family protein [Lampropedia puyangensis]THU03772.1 lysophospholipid acyltransferase family protein [Lampropedia puyangensis]
MFFLLRIFSFLPTPLLHAIGWLLGWLVFLLSPSYRKRFLENAHQAGFTFAQVRPAIGHAGRMVAELPKVWTGPPVKVDLDHASCQLLDQAWHAKQGVLFITPHMGCFELASQTVAQYWSDERGPLTVLYRPARKAFLAKMLESVRNRHGQQAVPTDMSGVRAMLKSLRHGGSVGLLPDQVPPWGMGDWAPFFGKPAYTMTIAARMIQQTQPQVIMARCERKPYGLGYRLFLSSLELNPAANQYELVHAINTAVEEQIRLCPEQYMWGYARYKSPRGMPDGSHHPQSIADIKSSS